MTQTWISGLLYPVMEVAIMEGQPCYGMVGSFSVEDETRQT